MNSAKANNSTSGIIYTIDADDCLIHVNEEWDKFATDNDASYLTHNHVLKSSLWNFISDEETRHVHKLLAERARRKKVQATLPFRCDSPSIRRYMRMQIIPGSENMITYHCRVDRIEHRAPILFQEQKDWREKKLLRVCSWCKKVDVGNNLWLELEAATSELQLLERKILPEFTHTMCDACLKSILEE